MTDTLGRSFPRLAEHLPKLTIAELPTPVRSTRLKTGSIDTQIDVKCDDLTSPVYGGNKVRKLEYLLQRALQHHARRVATFGTVASNHALATALHAARLNLSCTCFLSHQSKTDKASQALNLHLRYGTEIVRFGGDRRHRINTLREHLHHDPTWVIPMGGSSWLGAVGYVNAGLELAAQVDAGEICEPERIYVANGTMATAVGLAIGLALAELASEVHAIRVTRPDIANPPAMQRLLRKTITLMHRFDPEIPENLANRCRIRFRDEFFAGGYSRSDAATDRAIEIARDELNIFLEATYTGKAMAALLHDAAEPAASNRTVLFWNTYNSAPLPPNGSRPDNAGKLPAEFLRYFD